MNNIIFHCSAGKFAGVAEDGAIQIKGIRYADSKRFGRPVPYRYSDGVHEMTVSAPIGLQAGSVLEKYLTGFDSSAVKQVENCQFLSITIPENRKENEKIPVMVWIHGGSYCNGGCDNPMYERTHLAKEGNVIVVGVNFRMGLLGFMKNEDGKLSNNGLLDIIEALKWLQENIQAFGGDPENVTLFGQSSGADAIRCVMLSEGTDKLYKRAILHSDPIGLMSGREDMEKKMLREVNEMSDEASLQEIMRMQQSVTEHVTEKGLAKYMPFAPHYGRPPLPSEEMLDSRLKEIAKDHDIIVGVTKREVSTTVCLGKIMGKLYACPLSRWIVEAYIRNMTGKIYINPSKAFAKKYAMFGGNTYFYMFNWMEKEAMIGACHASDLVLLFGADNLGDSAITMGREAKEILELGKPMRKIWTDFAKTGSIASNKIDGVLEIALARK